MLETLRLKVYRKYQDLSLAFHDRQQKGDLLSRLMQDTQFLQGGLVAGVSVTLAPLGSRAFARASAAAAMTVKRFMELLGCRSRPDPGAAG
mgnify:CR=1 FL=1